MSETESCSPCGDEERASLFEQLGETTIIPPLFEVEPIVDLRGAHWELLFFDNGKLIFHTRAGLDERTKVCTVAEFEQYYVFADYPVFKKVE